MDVRLRDATLDDSDFVYSVKKAAVGDYVAATWGWDEEFQRAFHDRQFDPQRGKVVRVDDVDAGWLSVTDTPECVRIDQIYLLPPYQGRGVGTELIRDVLRTGGKAVTLRVLKTNERALRLYERLGFRVESDDAERWHLRAVSSSRPNNYG